eukprot:2287148-Rhodomonas_salina.1
MDKRQCTHACRQQCWHKQSRREHIWRQCWHKRRQCEHKRRQRELRQTWSLRSMEAEVRSLRLMDPAALLPTQTPRAHKVRTRHEHAAWRALWSG